MSDDSAPKSEPTRPDPIKPMTSPPVPQRAKVGDPDPTRRRDALPILYLVGFVVLAATLFYLWRNPPASRLEPQQAGRLDALQTQFAALRDEVSKLQQRPIPPAGPTQAAFDKLQEQAAAFEARPAVAPDQLASVARQVDTLAQKFQALPPTTDLQPVTQRLQALADQVGALPKPADLQPLAERLEALERRPPFDPAALDGKIAQVTKDATAAAAAAATASSGQIAALRSRLDDAAGRLDQDKAQLQARLDTLDRQQQQAAEQLKTLAQRASVAARLQSVSAALAAGQALGDLPGAPPALARFAAVAPPTEAALRESFDQYAAPAQKVSQPAAADDQSFGGRMWSRAQQSVTVRQGDRVLVGDPIAGILAHARELLDHGDLAGSVHALAGLPGPPAAALKPWMDSATALLDARAAVAGMAAN